MASSLAERKRKHSWGTVGQENLGSIQCPLSTQERTISAIPQIALMPQTHCEASHSNMFEETPRWKRNPVVTGLVLLALLISPIGAPLLGFISIAACDVPWEGEYRCFVPAQALDYFMGSFLLPFLWLGFFALPWFALCIALIIRSGWLFAAAVWGSIMERH